MQIRVTCEPMAPKWLPRAKPVTRSRRNLIRESRESTEKDICEAALQTPVKNSTTSSDSTSPKMSQDSVGSPARITRNQRSTSVNSNPPDSPCRNLRKRATSPLCVMNSVKIKTPSKKIEEVDNSSLVEMTPTKKLLKRTEGILSTVDSPKPRRTRYSMTDLPELSSENTNLRRSRRLSTELPVVTEDPTNEDVVDTICTIFPKLKRGKRLSVAPSQPALQEENELSELNSSKIKENSKDGCSNVINSENNEIASIIQEVNSSHLNKSIENKSPLTSPVLASKELNIVLNRYCPEDTIYNESHLGTDFSSPVKSLENSELEKKKEKSLNEHSNKASTEIEFEKNNSTADNMDEIKLSLDEERPDNNYSISSNKSSNTSLLNSNLECDSFKVNGDVSSPARNKSLISFNLSENKEKSFDALNISMKSKRRSSGAKNKSLNTSNLTYNDVIDVESSQTDSDVVISEPDTKNLQTDIIENTPTESDIIDSKLKIDVENIQADSDTAVSKLKIDLENIQTDSDTAVSKLDVKNSQNDAIENIQIDSDVVVSKFDVKDSQRDVIENIETISKLSGDEKFSSSDESDFELSSVGTGAKTLLDLYASDAASDYRSGDSMDESERREIEENEIVELGETLASDSENEDENSDDTYEKDSFICSSDAEDEILLSGTGDDLSSGEELTQSAKSKEKYNKKQKEKQKRVSKEMFSSRNSNEKSSKVNKIESDNSLDDQDDENEITIINVKNSSADITRDPLSISRDIKQKKKSITDNLNIEDDTDMSSDDDDLGIRNLYDEELKKLNNIGLDSDKSIEFENVLCENVSVHNKSMKGEKPDDIIEPPKKRKISAELNKTDVNIEKNTKNKKGKLNKSLSVLEVEKKQIDNETLSVQESMEKLKKMDESVSKIFIDFMKRMDKVNSSIDANILNSYSKNVESLDSIPQEIETNEVVAKRKNNLLDDDTNSEKNPQKKVCIAKNTQLSTEEPALSISTEIPTTEKSKLVPSCLKISDKSKTIKRRKNSGSDMRLDKISNAASKLRSIPSSLIERKDENAVISTSAFKVETKSKKHNTWTDTAGSFTVTSLETTRNMYNSTTSFKVVPLRKNPNQAIKIDKKYSTDFVNFKTKRLQENVKREPSNNLKKNKQKCNARFKANKW